MKVLRVESKDTHQGPYMYAHITKNRTLKLFLIRMAGRTDFHPTPLDEGISFPSSSYVCGFKNSKRLKDWFQKDLQKLLDRGFEVVEYSISDENVRLGRRQLIFDRDSAEERRVVHLRGI